MKKNGKIETKYMLQGRVIHESMEFEINSLMDIKKIGAIEYLIYSKEFTFDGNGGSQVIELKDLNEIRRNLLNEKNTNNKRTPR